MIPKKIKTFEIFFVLSRGFVSNSKHCISLQNRRLLRLSGIDVKKLLQGLCTNDVYSLKNKGDCIAATFLTPKGRICADSLIFNISDDDSKQDMIIETNNSTFLSLQSLINLYKLRSKVKINPLEANSILYVTSHIDVEESLSKIAGLDTTLVCSVDPRASGLGIRSIQINNTLEAGETIVSYPDDFIEGNMLTYERFRLLSGIAEGKELIDRIPLEMNLDLLHYIKFDKGCYVGQELTARTKYKGLIRKRLFPFSTRRPKTATLGSSLFHPVPPPLTEILDESVATATGDKPKVDLQAGELLCWHFNTNKTVDDNHSSSSSSSSEENDRQASVGEIIHYDSGKCGCSR